MQTKQAVISRELQLDVTEMADSHCHLDLIQNWGIVESAIDSGVSTIITDAVDTKSIVRTLQIADGKNVFAALGIDPEHAMELGSGTIDDELKFCSGLVREHAASVVAIGEIGLDYTISKDRLMIERQKKVFDFFLSLADELGLPASIHARGAISDVIGILKERGFGMAHLHFFEGSVDESKEAERLGCMISIPPLESGRRKTIIKSVGLENLLVESDSPVVGASPLAVRKSIMIVAAAKGISFEAAAEALSSNTKQFFRIGKTASRKLMRY